MNTLTVMNTLTIMNTLTDKVVAGFDGSWHSRPALERAVEAAVDRNLPLTILTVVSTVFDPELSSHEQSAAARARLEGSTAKAMHAAAEVRDREPTVPVSVKVVLDTDGDRLGSHLTGCRLLVLGDRGTSGSRAFLLGTVSRELMRLASCPVLVISGQARPQIRGDDADSASFAGAVVVGLGRDDEGIQVLRAAAAEATRTGARLFIVHSYAADGEGEGAQRLTKARELVDLRLQDAQLGEGLLVTTILTPHPAAESLLLAGRLAHLLVIGSRGPMALARLTLGSVSRQVLDATSTAVLVIPATAGRSTDDWASNRSSQLATPVVQH